MTTAAVVCTLHVQSPNQLNQFSQSVGDQHATDVSSALKRPPVKTASTQRQQQQQQHAAPWVATAAAMQTLLRDIHHQDQAH